MTKPEASFWPGAEQAAGAAANKSVTAAFPRLGRLLDVREFRHLPGELVLDDLAQGDVRGAEIAHVRNKGTADGAGAGIELANAAGNEVDQNVGVANLLECFFAEFSVQVDSIQMSRIEYGVGAQAQQKKGGRKALGC